MIFSVSLFPPNKSKLNSQPPLQLVPIISLAAPWKQNLTRFVYAPNGLKKVKRLMKNWKLYVSNKSAAWPIEGKRVCLFLLGGSNNQQNYNS